MTIKKVLQSLQNACDSLKSVLMILDKFGQAMVLSVSFFLAKHHPDIFNCSQDMNDRRMLK